MTCRTSVGVDKCPITRVIVYPTCAEVVRTIPLTKAVSVNNHGALEGILEVVGISNCAKPGSFRISTGCSSKHRLVVEDISTKARNATYAEAVALKPKIVQCVKSLESELNRRKFLQTECKRHDIQANMLDLFIESFVKGNVKKAYPDDLHQQQPGESSELRYRDEIRKFVNTSCISLSPNVALVAKMVDETAVLCQALSESVHDSSLRIWEQDAKVEMLTKEIRRVFPNVKIPKELAGHGSEEALYRFVKEFNHGYENNTPLDDCFGLRRRDVCLHVTLPDFPGPLPDEFQVELSYIVEGACWNPSYDWRMSGVDESIKLVYYGEVRQSTDEDWNDISVSLSAANPARKANPPVLPTRTVSIATPTPVKAMARAPRMAMQKSNEACLFGSAAVAVEACDVPDALVESSESSTELNIQFRIEKPTTIKADGEQHRVGISTLMLRGTLCHYSVPSEDTNIYMQVTAVNKSEIPLLPSRSVSVYLDDLYTCKTKMARVSPGEKFHCFVGPDPAVRIEKHNEQTKGSDIGLFVSNTRKQEFLARTLVVNSTTRPATVVLVRQLPLSTEEKIAVKLLNPSKFVIVAGASEDHDVLTTEDLTGPTDNAAFLNKSTNNLLQVCTLLPRSQVESEFSYTLEYPSSIKISYGKAAVL